MPGFSSQKGTIMSTPNATARVIEVVSTKYREDVALVAMVDALLLAQRQAAMLAPKGYDHLDGYRRGSRGDEGYSTIGTLSGSLFQPLVSELSALMEIALITRLLVVALQRMGEEIEH